MSEVEQLHREYAETPAGRFRSVFGISEQRDLEAEAQFIAAHQLAHRGAYGREYDGGELRSLEHAAEMRTRQVTRAVPVPSTSWEIAQKCRWGVSSPPPMDAAMGDVAWIARPG